MSRLLLLLSIAATSVASFDLGELILGREQSVSVKGRLFCNGAPAPHVKVKIYDVDVASPDDLMAEGWTDDNGHFALSGTESEFTDIDPKLNIYHLCNYTPACSNIFCNNCFQKISLIVPTGFIAEGKEAKRVFDVGTLKLEGTFTGQSVDCLN